jgi:hypothetical protein
MPAEDIGTAPGIFGRVRFAPVAVETTFETVVTAAFANTASAD